MKFAVIFDMDGVLVDSNDAIWSSHNEILGQHGVHFSIEENKQYLGKSLSDNIEDWNKKYGLSLELKSHTQDSWAIQLKMLEKMKANPNLVAFLDDLKSHNVAMGIGTSSQKFRAEKILEILKLKDYFTVLVTANDVQKHKPHPDLFLEAANRLGISPERCAVFEDAYSGIEAAKRGNMKTIGCLTKYNDLNELRNADLAIKNFLEVSYKKVSKMFS